MLLLRGINVVLFFRNQELLEQIKKKEQEDEDGNELEVTWEVGLKESAEELIKRKKDEKERKKLTPWESYLSERKQKKKMKRQAGEKKDEERFVECVYKQNFVVQ